MQIKSELYIAFSLQCITLGSFSNFRFSSQKSHKGDKSFPFANTSTSPLQNCLCSFVFVLLSTGGRKYESEYCSSLLLFGQRDWQVEALSSWLVS